MKNTTKLSPATPCFQVFIGTRLGSQFHCLVLPDEECSFETCENLENNGFHLIWDSAPSWFAGTQYAKDHYDAFIPVDRTEA